jgi:hypothetical protein
MNECMIVLCKCCSKIINIRNSGIMPSNLKKKKFHLGMKSDMAACRKPVYYIESSYKVAVIFAHENFRDAMQGMMEKWRSISSCKEGQ